jgi:hypothetical protein
MLRFSACVLVVRWAVVAGDTPTLLTLGGWMLVRSVPEL